MPLVDIDGCPINIEVEGQDDGPVLVLSNSLGTNLHMWDSQIRALSEKFRVVRYDCRGHGDSGVPTGPYSMERFGRDVLGILESLDVARFSWCGMSMGGMIGQWLGSNVPTRIEKLIISNTNSYYADKTPWNDRIAIAKSKGLEALADTIMQRWFTDGFRRRSAGEVARIRKMFIETPVAGYIASCEAIRDMDFRLTNSHVSAPTLIIVGTKDPATPPHDGEIIHGQIRGSKLTTLEAAHISNIEQSEKYTQTVLEFLN